MKTTLLLLIAICLFNGCKTNGKKTAGKSSDTFVDMNGDGKLQPYEDTTLSTQKRVEDLLSRLTNDEKASLLIGTGMAGLSHNNLDSLNPVVGESNYSIAGAAGTTTPLAKYGLRAIVMTDGPAGVRISPKRDGDKNTYYATGFPVGVALASTWDVELVKKVGEAIGNEALEYGSDIQLAPALNIMRNPLCGRNFEYYSEDPVIAGKMASAFTKGVQSQNVGVSIKHFAANNNETNRMSIDVHASPRALREIYLRGFEIAVKESSPKTVMSSYNKINGTYASASRDLLTTILRNEWGFKGLVMSDWFGGCPDFKSRTSKSTSNTIQQILAGNDLLMPGLRFQKEDILNGLKNGLIKQEDIDTNVKRVLTMIFESPKMRSYPYSNKPNLKAHAGITRTTAAEGMVLLKNNASVLPLSSSVKSIATYGVTSFKFIAGGTGSGDVNKAYTVSLEEGLKNAGFEVNETLRSMYGPFAKKELDRVAKELEKNRFMPVSFNEMDLDVSVIKETARSADMAIVTIGRSSGEFADRKAVKGDFYLSDIEMNLLRNVSDIFHKMDKKVVVVLNIGGVMETASWKGLADAILLTWQPGQEGGNSVADILTGKVNPSGRLTMTFPARYTDVSSAANFPGKPADNPKTVDYKEGVYVGYRYYTSFNIKPSYEFGYGLSYTKFDFSDIKLSDKDFTADSMIIDVDIKNTGTVAGKEVVQLYLAAPAGKIDKPVRELKAFAKTRVLKPDEIQTIEFILHKKDLASFYNNRSAWVADKGNYKIEIGNSSQNILSATSFSLPSEIEVEKVKPVLNNSSAFSDMKH